ncbi:MAG: outer membrane lipoprotein-sorting protein, partial [Treponema sp.]|nr:outer membrane lipoprotein-sorting protein [Treponema sp.]
MRKALMTVALAAAIAGLGFARTPTAAELLARVDDNEIFTTIQYEAEMIVYHQGRRFVRTMNAWARGGGFSFMEFTNPEDRGTRYLMENGRLWVISPDIERARRISGHMLRESMMGSDMSYEDAINNEPLADRYNAVLVGAELLAAGVWAGRNTWVLDLTARRRGETYPRRMLWIDQETGDLLRQDFFALSGARLKEYNLLRVETIGGRRFPVEV